MTQYTAIVHTPGYLPDSPDNVEAFDTLDEARDWLADEIERDWDAAYEAASIDGTSDQQAQARLVVDGDYLTAHTEISHLQPGDSVRAGDLSYEIQTT
jgi:hypothetical protein